MKSKLITVSAISTALVAISLTIGAYFEVADLFSLILASAFVVIPLYFNSKKASFLTYLAGGVIAIILSGFNFAYSIVFPSYFIYFGVFPILFNIIDGRTNKKVLTIILGLIWTIAVVYGMFYYYTAIIGLDLFTLPTWMPIWVKDYIIYLLGILAVFFFILYYRYVLVVKYFFRRYLDRIFNR